ncbi:DDE superfamily endonuclease [Variovorax sp. YR266]|nr:DDE superfamily endonuclease [Variovorax sp. YR266]
MRFATKTQIALQQLRTLLDEGASRHCVLADVGYGVDNAFRQALSNMGLLYAVDVTSTVVVWPPAVQPLPPKPYSGMGRPPVMPRRTASLQPMSVKALAHSLPSRAFQNISWREGTNDALKDRFAAVRVRHAGGNTGKARLRPEHWLLIEWPAGDAEPSKYFSSTLPEDTPINDLVDVAHQRWRIERDYQDLKQDFGLGHYEGRGWRGFHHHAALSIAAYGFLMAERLVSDKSVGGKKTSSNAKCLHFPRTTSPAAVLRAQRHVPTSIKTLRHRLSHQLIARLRQCPCCGRAGVNLLW